MAQVKVYSTPTCPYCIRVKEYLKQKNVSFQNIDVSADKASLEEMVKLTGQMGVPVVVIDGNIVVGFDRVKIESLLNIA
ncbi:MAG: Uxx-star family glutaredoxin-like (seleno)protein [Candidatus Omnitrophica bacterium]|nr:Uxx-star family glutaredoxin-like (seleno)protein [Candidatus Omnitrophota bacterium]MDD5352889.1 Uxx-star family glutaredoxin-like (seleno)protein [Candidatus Omnitrophota bacterium]MDD5550488.1 Uxx-star family glutaredoxin-like (seleno)protein [Candidatus Omnitrophota bacterium]